MCDIDAEYEEVLQYDDESDSKKETDFFTVERLAQNELIRQEQRAIEALEFERRLLIRTAIKDIVSLMQAGALRTRAEVSDYLRRFEIAFGERFINIGRTIESEMEKIALARQYFYIVHQTETDLARDIDRLRAVQSRFFTDFKSIPRETSQRLRLEIVKLLDKQNIAGVNESETARAIQSVVDVSFNRARFIATQSQSLYLGYQRKYQIDELGATEFKYRGTVKRTTRQFCLFALGRPSRIGKRDNNIWTMRDIKIWDRRNWEGKIPNVPLLVQAGGYRCRHAIVPKF